MKSFYSVKSLMEKCNNIRVLVRVPELIPVSYVQELYDLGVHGVYTLSVNSTSLSHIIGIVLKGEKFIPFDLAETLLRYAERKSDYHKLSRLEREIFILISIGVSNKEIAKYTGIQSSTVKVHNKSIFRKLNVRNRAEAMTKFHSECELDYYDARASMVSAVSAKYGSGFSVRDNRGKLNSGDRYVL